MPYPTMHPSISHRLLSTMLLIVWAVFAMSYRLRYQDLDSVLVSAGARLSISIRTLSVLLQSLYDRMKIHLFQWRKLSQLSPSSETEHPSLNLLCQNEARRENSQSSSQLQEKYWACWGKSFFFLHPCSDQSTCFPILSLFLSPITQNLWELSHEGI